MKKRKVTWKDLSIIEKIFVIIFYIIGLLNVISIPILMYLGSNLFW